MLIVSRLANVFQAIGRFFSKLSISNLKLAFYYMLHRNDGQKGADFYDFVYSQGGANGEYLKRYDTSVYYPVWLKVLEIVTRLNNPSVLDVGCGPGQFASMLFDNGILKYKGFDFSCEAVSLAQAVSPKMKHAFYCDDAFNSVAYKGDVDVAIILEVLEHVHDGLGLLSNIAAGTKVIMSVPNFDSCSHVRSFKSIDEAKNRYRRAVDIIEEYTIELVSNPQNKLFLIYGVILPGK